MSCPHGKASSPDTCSQCIGARARQVTNDGPLVLIDGQPTDRVLDRTGELSTYYARRGGLARSRRRKDATP